MIANHVQQKITFLLILFLITGLHQQQVHSAEPPQKPPAGLQMVPQQTTAEKVKIARNFIRTRNYPTAVAILEALYETDPNNAVINNLLRNCYNQLGTYTKAEMMVRRQIERAPSTFIYHVYLAEALARQGFTDSAYTSYKQAMNLIANDNVNEYKIVVNSMLAHSLTKETVALINNIRKRKNDQSLFAYEAGVMLEADGDYVGATNQYLVALSDTSRDASRTASMAENKILSLLMFEETFPTIEKVLKNQTSKALNKRAARVLSNAYLNKKMLKQAFEYALIRDSLEGSKGTSLLQFLRSCIDSRQYDLAVQMAEKILQLYDKSPVYAETYFLYADLLVKLGQYDKAISVYDSVIARFPRNIDRLQATVQIGYIYLDNIKNYDRALTVFDSVLTNKGQGGLFFKAMKGVPHAYLRKGELDSAQAKFLALKNTRLPKDMTEEASYYLAEIDFLKKNIDSSKAGLNKLLVEYPRGFYVNDALELLLLMEDIADDSTLLDVFVKARKFQRMLMIDSTVASLKTVASANHPELSPMALFQLSEMSIEMFDTVGALGYIKTLSDDFNESYYYPYGQKLKAEILLNDVQSSKEGEEIYKTLLEKYPNYPFASDLRKKLRQLVEDTKIG